MLWLKAFHIIFVVCWFAGLFYLPRIFVYYAATEHQSVRNQLAVMARKLYRFVTPFMIIAIGLGGIMITLNPDYYLSSRWMWLKLGGVTFLIVYHIMCGRYVRAINSNRNQHNHVFYRFFNEVPVLFLFAIVILAVVKPF
jgi:putative membrane protein